MTSVDDDLRVFRTLRGARLDLSGDLLVKRSHVLQRFRDVWVVVNQFPYLAIDENKVSEYSNNLNEFPVFVSGFLYQNVSRTDFVQRLTASLASPAITGGFSKTSGVLVEGRANPRSHGLITFNDPLYIGMYPYCALGTKYIYVEEQHIYQHTIGELVVVDKHSRPNSTFMDFNRLAELQLNLFQKYMGVPSNGDLSNITDLENTLDEIFKQNEMILSTAEMHHRSLAPYSTDYDYEAPVLTKYGRLTHDQTGNPQIEISFALLHYETALREFDALKKAAARNDVDGRFSHGVSCVVAAAGCIEAAANKLVFLATGSHPSYKDRRQPLPKINDSCSTLAARSGRSFAPLLPGQAAFDALDELRVQRNAFMHANEEEADIEPSTRESVRVAAIDESKCRLYLAQLRLGIQQIFTQLPDLSPPIETRTNVVWLGDVEVP